MESIKCPGCTKAIRVPEDVIGRKAQCPFCKCHFRAVRNEADGRVEASLVRRHPWSFERRVSAAIILTAVGVVALLFNGITAVRSAVDPEGFAQDLRERMEQQAAADVIELSVKWAPRVRIACAVLGVVTIAGGIAMLKMKRHGLAMAGAAAALFNVPGTCCLGIFAGGWAMSILMHPDTRAQFSAASIPGSAPVPTPNPASTGGGSTDSGPPPPEGATAIPK